MRDRSSTTISSVLTSLVLTAVGLLTISSVAGADSGLPASITISPDGAQPGAEVQVAGLDFPSGQTVQLQLTTTAGAIALGTAVTEDGGYFRQNVTLPADIPPGFWELRATAPDGSVAVLIFESGAAAPALPADAAPPTVAEAAAEGFSGVDIMVMLVVALLVSGIGGAFAYAWFVIRREGRQPGMGAGDDPIWSGGHADEPLQSTSTGVQLSAPATQVTAPSGQLNAPAAQLGAPGGT